MKYFLVRMEENLMLIDEKQANDIRNELNDLSKLTDMLSGELRFDCFMLNTTHINSRTVVTMEFIFAEKRRYKLAFISKQKRGLKQNIYMGVLLDYDEKEMDGMHYNDFFETMAKFYIRIQDLIKAKLFDINFLINEALDNGEEDWFKDLADKKKFLESKVIIKGKY